MLKCVVDGKTIGFSFEHVQGIGEEVGLQAMTMCRLTVGDMPDIELYTSQAWCSAADRFDKEIGRKISLARALFMSKLSRTERAAVWLRYWNRDLNNKEYVQAVANQGKTDDKKDADLGLC